MQEREEKKEQLAVKASVSRQFSAFRRYFAATAIGSGTLRPNAFWGVATPDSRGSPHGAPGRSLTPFWRLPTCSRGPKLPFFGIPYALVGLVRPGRVCARAGAPWHERVYEWGCTHACAEGCFRSLRAICSVALLLVSLLIVVTTLISMAAWDHAFFHSTSIHAPAAQVAAWRCLRAPCFVSMWVCAWRQGRTYVLSLAEAITLVW